MKVRKKERFKVLRGDRNLQKAVDNLYKYLHH